ncbi:MAG: aminotransferase class III-fold pyridoxal phosphate-dependent enzyme, partial [Candidatus Heimdallarchaeota archaeon]|nr:aminotransferase class III-fold pyridoxal phosphate-dependent enzyme [Candidatus Heimdallarchaeota archaeon]
SKTKIANLHSFLKSLSYPFIQEIRSYGLIFAIELQAFENLSTTDLILKIKDDLLDEGVMIGYSIGKEQIRFLPPLIISGDEIKFLQVKIIKVFDSILP